MSDNSPAKPGEEASQAHFARDPLETAAGSSGTEERFDSVSGPEPSGPFMPETGSGEGAPALCDRDTLPPHIPPVSPEIEKQLDSVDVEIIEPERGGGTILVAVAEPPEEASIARSGDEDRPDEPAGGEGAADAASRDVPGEPDDDALSAGDVCGAGIDIPDYSDLVEVAAVRLGTLGPASFFVADNVACTPGDKVIVEVDEGLAFGEVATVTRMNPEHLVTGENKEHSDTRGGSGGKIHRVVRKAGDKDLVSAAENADLVADAINYCRTCIRERDLDMKLVDVLILHNRSKMVFYFTAPSRIDFRELVKDLVRSYRTRIELRQIGVRHETQMVGAVGNCGMVCCCRRYLRTFAPVAIKMAKEQNVFLNPVKISGICGRLLCCLAYEQEHYDEFYKRCPKLGKKYQTDAGAMRVLRASLFRESVSVLNENNEEVEYPLDAWNELNPHRPNAPQPGQQQGRSQKQGVKGRQSQDRKRPAEDGTGTARSPADSDGDAIGDEKRSGTLAGRGDLQKEAAPREYEVARELTGEAGNAASPASAAAAPGSFGIAANEANAFAVAQSDPTVNDADEPLDDIGNTDDDDGGSIFGLRPGRPDAGDNTGESARDAGEEQGAATPDGPKKPFRQRQGRRRSRPPRRP